MERTTVTTMEASRSPWPGLVRVVGVLLAELLIIHYARHALNFECHTERYGFCGVARNALLASYSLAAVFILLGVFARDAWRDLLSDADIRTRPLTANLAGLGVLLGSLAFLRGDLSVFAQAAIYAVWLVSAGMALGGAVLMIAPLERWRAFTARLGWRLPFVALAGLAAPFVAVQIRPFWNVEFLSDQTFHLVTWLLAAWGQGVETYEGSKVIGAEGFFINVAPSCSGIEGLVLTTSFALIYLVLFRRDLRFPHAFLILPVALCASWILNGLRIAVLVQLGISGYPGLAVGGFHSHAGWLMFTLLSLGIVLVTQSTGVFRAPDVKAVSHKAPPPFFSDPVVAQILPFLVFMATALLSSTFSETPSLLYPLRALAVGAVLWLILPYLRSLPWRFDALAAASGVAIGIVWIATGPVSEGPPPFYDLTGMALAVWIVARVIGTSLFVPILEELMFRSYTQGRIAPEGASMLRTALAIGITTVLFAALHDRWIAAALAGLIFSALMVRSQNITDAILSHGLANLTIALWALATGAWHIL
jgi:exosortase E/protease (VPEID-CTERM system)